MTKKEEFKRFNELLMKNAPEGYIPWYFPVIAKNKAPDALAIAKRAPPDCDPKERSSWKSPHARLTAEEAMARMEIGGNVGIAGRSDDPLIIIDIDDWGHLQEMPPTLVVRSRKRCGLHGFCWKHPDCEKLPINLPTAHGEIRSSDQYVVAAGSYVQTNPESLNNEIMPEIFRYGYQKDELLGYYTVDKIGPMSMIRFEELPHLFLKQHKKNQENQKRVAKMRTEPVKSDGKTSALFKLTIHDVVSVTKARESHPLHNSDTGMNFSIKGELAHCWRHLVSLNPIQFLTVKSGYMNCQEAGTPHKGGTSHIIGDEGAIFHAWLQAKKDGVIPANDPVPVKAMWYVARKHELLDKEVDGWDGWKLPAKVFNKVLETIKEKY